MNQITRSEHLASCKKRALEYCDRGLINDAFTSIMSNLRKHPETVNATLEELGMQLLMTGNLSTEMAMRSWIEGFN